MSKIKTKHFLIAGIFLRIVYFIINLGRGFQLDEDMLTLNAVSLAERMTDAAGERLPVYFDTWLTGGQSPLPTYLSALFFKLFEFTRIPMLIISIIGFVAFLGFVKEVFKEEKQRIILAGIAAVSPWLIFSSTYVLDCNYLAHMLIVAFYFIAKAINDEKLKWYILSMMFFALGFYSYIASVLLIPIILVVMFFILLLKKKIRIKETAVSVISLFVFSLPFILFGLVAVDVIPEFKLLGFSFSKMPFYTRADSIAFLENGIVGYFESGLLNIVQSFILIFAPESCVKGLGMNIFFYSNLFGGLFIFIAVYELVKSAVRKTKDFTFLQKLFALSSFAGILFYCFNVNFVSIAYAYRYGILSYLLLFLEGIGIACLVKHLKKDNIKIFLIYLLVSFAIFNAEYFGQYIPHTTNTDDIIYGDSLYDCIEKAEGEDDKIIIINDSLQMQYRVSVYCRSYYALGDMQFVNIGEEFKERYMKEQGKINSKVKLTPDDSIEICSFDEAEISDEYSYIVPPEYANSFGDAATYNAGYWTLIYEKNEA